MMSEKIKQIMMIIIGNMLIAFAISVLVVDNGIIAGGVSGLGLSLSYYFNIPLTLAVTTLNILLFFIGLFYVGKEFASKTLLSTFIFPIILNLFESTTIFNGIFIDPFVICLLAGSCIGLGIGLVMKANCSTGGVDVLAIVLSKKMRIPVHIILNIIDISILLSQMIFSEPSKIVYGIIIVFITSLVLNQTLTMGTSLIQLTIISDQYMIIRDYILNDADAGLTLLNSQKGFTLDDSKLVLSIIPYQKLTSMKQNILKIDPTAFMIVSKVEEVGGRGFTLER